jgi:hypothetical protein
VSAPRRYTADVALIAFAGLLQYLALPAAWIENDYANGIYATLARTFVPLANAVPFTIGDAILCAIVAGVGLYWIVGWRTRGGSRLGRAAALGLRTAAVAAAILIWFDGAWALNYRRVPIVGRVAYDPARLSARNVSAFSAEIVADLNRTAPLAHAEHLTEPQLEGALAAAFAPVVRRLGDRYDVIVSRPKRTLFDGWFAMAGIGGLWDPFAYETVLNAEFLPFERPFAIAHEWGHVAGFGDESDANLIAALTTMRSGDAFIRYSGLFWAYGFLPEADRRALRVSALVKADLRAARRRFLRTYNPNLYALQWYVYDKYLRANRVSAGVVSYTQFVQVLVGTPLDRDGLPQLRDRPIGVDPRRASMIGSMSEKKASALAIKAAEKARKQRESDRLGSAAIVESAKIRARFDDERQALARRYGVISGLS